MRHALLVANENYADVGLRSLAAPGRDVDALASVLSDPSIGEFDVSIVRDATAHEVRVAVEDFFAERAPEDLLVMHFSCHGVKNAAGELYLAAVDSRPTRLASTAVAADFVNRQMADSRAQRIVLFLDCCYGGAFPRGMVVRADSAAHVREAFGGLDDVAGGRGRVVITASSAMQYAFEGAELTAADGDTGPSIFTAALVDGLTSGDADRDGDGWVGLGELFGFVSEQVARTVTYQTPQMWTFGAQGDLRIARAPARRITPTALPEHVVDAMTNALALVRYGATDELKDRLQGSDVRQSLAAWQALVELSDDDSRKVADAARSALESAALRVTPEALDLALVDGRPEGDLRLDGPPLALTAAATAVEPWLHVTRDGSRVRVTADPESTGRMGSITLSGPALPELRVPVRSPGSRGTPRPVRRSRPERPRQETAGLGVRLGPRGYLLGLIDLALLIVGMVLGGAAGLDSAELVYPIATTLLVIGCLAVRALPALLFAVLSTAALALLCAAAAIPTRATDRLGPARIDLLPAVVLCAIGAAAVTAALAASYRPGPDTGGAPGYRLTASTLAVVTVLATTLSLSGLDRINQIWCEMQSSRLCAGNSVIHQWPLLAARAVPVLAVLAVLLRAGLLGRRRTVVMAAAAAAFLCAANATSDLVQHVAIAPHTSEGEILSRLITYSTGGLVICGLFAGATTINPRWVSSITIR